MVFIQHLYRAIENTSIVSWNFDLVSWVIIQSIASVVNILWRFIRQIVK